MTRRQRLSPGEEHALNRLAAALLLLVLPLAPARGQETLGVLAVADPPGPGPELAAHAGRLRAALAAQAAGVLEEAELRERMAGRPPSAKLGELDRAYAGALAAQAAGEFEDSNRTLRAVAAALEALPEGPEVFAAWTRVMARLARSEQELGRGLEAQAVLERLLRAAPELKADTRQYPPSYHNLVQEARARLRALGTHRLTVEAQPGVRVFVEGREVGAAPVTVELAPGRYRVTGLRGGMSAPARLVELDGNLSVLLDMSLAEALRPDGGPGLALGTADRASRSITVASRLGLDRMTTVELVRKGEVSWLAAALHDVRRGGVEREGHVRLDGEAPPVEALEALAAYLLTGRPSPLVSAPAGPSLALDGVPAEPLVPASPGRAYGARASTGLGWTAVGTGAATLVAGTLTLVYARDAQARYEDARRLVGPDGRVQPPATVAGYNALVKSGDDRRSTAIALGAAGGAALVTTVVLGYLSYRQTGEIGPFRF